MAKRTRSAAERAAQTENLRCRPARGRILAAARELAAASGYEAVRVGELADAAGVSRETFYTHFADKRACLAEATDPRLGEIEQLLRISIEEGEEWAESLLGSVDEQIAQRFGAERGPRVKIMAAMVELAAARGLAGTRLADVIKAAHVSYPSFYRHFESKEQCFAGACEWLAQDLQRRIEATAELRAQEGSGPAARLVILAELLAAEPAAARVLLLEAGAMAIPANAVPPRGPRTSKRSAPETAAPSRPNPLPGLIETLLTGAGSGESTQSRMHLALLAGSIVETMRAAALHGELARIPASTEALLDLLPKESTRARRPARRGASRRTGSPSSRRSGSRQVPAAA